MTPLRWASTIAGMFLGYMVAGPVGGFVGLGLGWWLGQRHPQPPPSPPPGADGRLADAFRTLGIPRNASKDQARTAYRRLMNRNHPDKLAARGAGEADIQRAQQATHEIRKAYDLIRRMKE